MTRERKVSRAREQRLRQGGLFVPLVFVLTAEFDGIPAEELLASPTKLSNGLRTMFGFFGVDGVVGWCDDTVLAATLGYTRDWSTYPPAVTAPPEGLDVGRANLDDGAAAIAADVIGRLGSLLPDTILVASMPGPVALAMQLADGTDGALCDDGTLRAAGKVCLEYAKLLGEAGLDLLLVREPSLPQPTETLSSGDVVRLYSPIWNTARHYGMAALLMPAAADVSSLARFASVIDGVVVPPEDVAAARTHFRRVGVGLPAGLLGRPASDVEEYLGEHELVGLVSNGVFLVTTTDEVPPDVDREALIAGVRVIRDRIKEAIS